LTFTETRLSLSRTYALPEREDAPTTAPVALTPVGYEHLSLLPEALEPAMEVPSSEDPPPADSRLANPNPYGFTPSLPEIFYAQEPILAEDGTVIGYLDTCTWQQDGYTSTFVVEYDADFNVVSTLYYDSAGYSSYSLFYAVVDEEGNITGYENFSSWTDGTGAWGESVNVYDASWQFLGSEYRDSWGNIVNTVYFYAEDGSRAGQEVRASWTDAEGGVTETTTVYDANWQCIYTESRDSWGTTVTTQYIYGETGELVALEITASGVDENGEAWSSYTWQPMVEVDTGGIDWVDLLPVTEVPPEEPRPEEIPQIIICEFLVPHPETIDLDLQPPEAIEPIPVEWLRPAELVGVPGNW